MLNIFSVGAGRPITGGRGLALTSNILRGSGLEPLGVSTPGYSGIPGRICVDCLEVKCSCDFSSDMFVFSLLGPFDLGTESTDFP